MTPKMNGGSRRQQLGLLIALLASLIAAGPALAEGAPAPPILPGLGAHDPRVRVDPTVLPWRALGKLTGLSAGLSVNCTGTLVGPALVLTAAHCVVNPKTRRYFPPGALHFLLSYAGGDFAGHAVATRLTVGPGYDPAQPSKTLGSDWALLSLDKRLGTPDRILAIEATPLANGTAVAIGGYNQDHARLLFADEACRILGTVVDRGGHPLLHHNCSGTRGTSGAPLLVEDHGVWRVAGVHVAAERGVASGVAVPLDEIRQRF
jgi:protease YdgD